MNYCYIRKSTDKQQYTRQINILKNNNYIDGLNCKYIFENYTGKTLDRKELKKLLDNIKKNDVLIVESLSRLSRTNIIDALQLIENEITKKDITIISLKENMTITKDNLNSSISFMLGIHLLLAKQERQLISERTKESLQALKQKGVKLGRPTKKDLSVENIKKCLQLQIYNNLSVKESFYKRKIPKASYYYHIKELYKKYNVNNNINLLEKLGG